MGSCAKIDASCNDNCLQGETIGCRKKCNEALCNEHIIKILTNNDCYTRYYRARRFVFFFYLFFLVFLIFMVVKRLRSDVNGLYARRMTINNKFREKNTAHKIVSSSTLSRYRIHRGSKLFEMSSPFEINFSRISLFFSPLFSCQNRRGVCAFFLFFFYLRYCNREIGQTISTRVVVLKPRELFTRFDVCS